MTAILIAAGAGLLVGGFTMNRMGKGDIADAESRADVAEAQAEMVSNVESVVTAAVASEVTKSMTDLGLSDAGRAAWLCDPDGPMEIDTLACMVIQCWQLGIAGGSKAEATQCEKLSHVLTAREIRRVCEADLDSDACYTLMAGKL